MPNLFSNVQMLSKIAGAASPMAAEGSCLIYCAKGTEAATLELPILATSTVNIQIVWSSTTATYSAGWSINGSPVASPLCETTAPHRNVTTATTFEPGVYTITATGGDSTVMIVAVVGPDTGDDCVQIDASVLAYASPHSLHYEVGLLTASGALRPFRSWSDDADISPSALSRGPDGLFYVGTNNTGTPKGVRVVNPGTGSDQELGASSVELDDPETVAFGPDGSLFVVERTHSKIWKYSITTGVGSVWATVPTFQPWGITVRSDGTVYVTSFSSNLWQFDASGGLVGTFDASALTTGLGGLDSGPDNLIYIANSTVSGFITFDPDTGTFAPGATRSFTDQPESLAFHRGRVYLMTRNNFDGDGEFYSFLPDGSDPQSHATFPVTGAVPLGITSV